MILASRTTWRSTISCIDFRNCSTPRSSVGIARTTTTPDCAFTTTLRPAPPPRIAFSDFWISPQKSESEVVVTRVLSAARVLPAPVGPVVGTGTLPALGVPGLDGASVIEPELTRVWV